MVSPTPQQIDQLLAEAVRRLRVALDPISIYFFGSLAQSRGGPGSDLDLVVVVEKSADDFYQRSGKAHIALGDLGIPVDVMVYTRDEFDTRANWPVSFERSVRTSGKLVYAA